MPTKQETFDTVVSNLRRQGGRSRANGTHPMLPAGEMADYCAYRGDGGRRCAAGWLIPDDRYRPSMEGHVIKSLSGQLGEAGMIIRSLGHDIALVGELQIVHDSSDDRWESGWADTAARHSLIYTPPGQPFPSQLVQIPCPEHANLGTTVAVAS